MNYVKIGETRAWFCTGIICPIVLILPIEWQKTNPLWRVKVVTLEERISSGVCSPPGHAFSHSVKLAELCAAGESPSGNMQQCRRDTDFFQRCTLEECFLLNSAKFVRKDSGCCKCLHCAKAEHMISVTSVHERSTLCSCRHRSHFFHECGRHVGGVLRSS